MLNKIKKLSFWKGLSDFFLYLIIFGFFTGIITSEFYKLASYFLIPGLVATIIFLVRSFARD